MSYMKQVIFDFEKLELGFGRNPSSFYFYLIDKKDNLERFYPVCFLDNKLHVPNGKGVCKLIIDISKISITYLKHFEEVFKPRKGMPSTTVLDTNFLNSSLNAGTYLKEIGPEGP